MFGVNVFFTMLTFVLYCDIDAETREILLSDNAKRFESVTDALFIMDFETFNMLGNIPNNKTNVVIENDLQVVGPNVKTYKTFWSAVKSAMSPPYNVKEENIIYVIGKLCNEVIYKLWLSCKLLHINIINHRSIKGYRTNDVPSRSSLTSTYLFTLNEVDNTKELYYRA